ncbi:MAG: type III-A CRISPR-associated RAMP protein Csm5 [Thermogladius sp.]|nr:type III-A CRISPR-associated RAMP protein Csm5 [Thermogladius sp.]
MPSQLAASRTLELILRPLTPLHVWSGRRLLMGLDVVRRGGNLCFVDIERLPPEMVNQLYSTPAEQIPRVLEKYSAQLPCRLEVKFTGFLPPKAQILELNQYVVPGSTLKGYIRTAVLYLMLKAIGEKGLAEALRRGVNLDEKPKNVAQGLEAEFFRAPRPGGEGGFVDSFQSLLVSDPGVVVDPRCLVVSEIRVVELLGRELKRIASQYALLATCGELKYRVSVRAPGKSAVSNIARPLREHFKDIERLRVLEEVDLIKALRDFGCYILSKELERVKSFKDLAGYADMLEDLHRRYCSKPSDCVVARIGYSTGLTAKTVLGVVKEADPQLYQEVRSLMERSLHHTWDELTIKLVETPRGLVGLGWCELCVH